ncbi:MAG: efflux RND transporter periplasmic adaptor subunit [Desulfomonile tiedjei]|nr:efflux RND transporter periplasmic adaptor subunit [Desulfomonile tiedjei]
MTRKKVLMAAGALVGMIVVLIWVQGGFHSKVPGGATPIPETGQKPVQTVKAEVSQSSGGVTVSGTVIPRETARVASRVSGYVVELNVDAGQQVKKGQVLLRIDARELTEREAQARAALDGAKADMAKAKTDFERYSTLFEQQAVAKQAYDDAKTKYETAQAGEARAESLLEEAKTQLEYARVVAPFDGIIATREVNVGDLASPGQALLTVYMPGTLELVAPVGEQYGPFLKASDPVTVEVDSVGLKQASTIREVVPQREPKTRTITVKVPLPEHAGLVPGLYGTLTFKTRASEVITIPAEAVKSVGQLTTVRVLEGGKISIRHVKTGRNLEGDRIEILSGLNPGEEVVVK